MAIDVHEVVGRCDALARSFGGQVLLVDELPNRPGVSHAPFDAWLAVDYEQQIVYVEPSLTELGGVIHEMGHVFASRRFNVSEWTFFGWEYCVAVKLDLLYLWDSSAANYQVSGDGIVGEWGNLDSEECDQLIRSRIAYAIRHRLVTPDRQPLSVRRPVKKVKAA